jgi:FHA domain
VDQAIDGSGTYSMTEGRAAARRPGRAPLRPRSRRRWAIIGGVAACWVVLEVVTGSAVSATVLLVTIAGLGAAAAGGLRALGVTRDHPWLRRLASRPWRDGEDVLKVALRHLPDVFVVTPSGSLLAPNLVELQLNPDDLASLCQRMELGVISASVAEIYQEQVAAHGARFAGPARPGVHVTAAGSVPPGRYRLRQANLASNDAQPEQPDLWYGEVAPEFAPEFAAEFAPEFAPATPQYGYAGGMVTIREESLAPVPVLRLVTGSSVAETTMSGARAGRGPVELVLPGVPTVSREHARFTFSDGRWWISNQGRNGLTLNGAAVAGEQPLSDGDAIRWGARPDALMSRVEIS